MRGSRTPARSPHTVVVADHQTDLAALAVSGGTAYWIAGKHDITRAGADGTPAQVLWQTKREAHGLAVLAGVVYWVEKTPQYDDAVMTLANAAGTAREVLHLPAVADLIADGEALFIGLEQGGIVRFDAASGRASLLAGTDSTATLSVDGSFVYWASPREVAAYRVDKQGGIPQRLMLSPGGRSDYIPIKAISASGNRAIWLAHDDFDPLRIAEGDLAGPCVRILWSTVDRTTSTVHADDAGVYWSSGGRVLEQPSH